MHYLIASFTHKNTTISIRDKLSFKDDEQKIEFLKQALELTHIGEAILVATCNRIEMIVSTNNIFVSTEYIAKLFSSHSDIDLLELEGRMDTFEDQSAIHHLFSVASSLDSLVVGETQITGQLKDAFKFSRAHKFCGDKLTRAINYAFRCAAEVRNSTNISSKPVSIASVAVASSRQKLGSLDGVKALVIGSGEMSVIAVKTLLNHGASVTMMNRTLTKIEHLASEVNVSIESYDNLSEVLGDYELIFTATSSPSPIITNDMASTSCSSRCYWYDMAIPRDIEDISCDLIEVLRIDDLKNIVDENIMLREEEARESFAIVGAHTQEFYSWLKSLNIEPIIKELYVRADRAAFDETTRALKSGYITKEQFDSSLKLARQALKRYLHPHAKRLRAVVDIGDIDAMMESMRYILDRPKE